MKERAAFAVSVPRRDLSRKPYHVTDNELDRDFQADKPMEKRHRHHLPLLWKLQTYLSSIMDLYNREIVAYSISECQDTDCARHAINELPQGHYSDRGSVYT